ERVPADTRVRVLFTPAFPGSGRITEDGVQLLNGVPLEHTELAHDPLYPMTTSAVADILAAQSDLAVRHVPVRQITQSMLTAPCRPVTNRSCCVTRVVSSTWPTSPRRRPPHTTTTAPCGCPSTPDRPEPSWPTPYVCADRPEPAGRSSACPEAPPA